jgi:hypothetical protein
MLLNLIFANPESTSFVAGMEKAALLLDQAITNPITVNIVVGYGGVFGDLPDQNTSVGGIGLPVPIPYQLLYVDLWLNDTNSVKGLPFASTLDGHELVTISTAQAKAFGLFAPDIGIPDGFVDIGRNFTGDQLVAAGLHELTHAMGRIAAPYPLVTSLDLFRYNADGSGRRVYDTGIPSTAAYFSMDGGATKLADFGIASDPGDFLTNGVQGVDPFNETVGGNALTHVDLQIMDALGFRDDVSNPFEPQSMLPVATGGTATISNDFLWATDIDNTPEQLTYRVLNAPAHGTVLVNGIAASRFTEADIDNRRVQYRQNGDHATRDGFTFQVSDPAGNSTPVETFPIAILDTTGPAIENNNGIVATVAGDVLLFNSFLDTVALGSAPGQLRYAVLTAPVHGSIVVDGVATDRFTQADLDNYRVLYRQNGDAALSDSFTFQVTDAAGNRTAAASFNIAILPTAPDPRAQLNSIVTALYNQVLDRQPETAGFARWVSALAGGAAPADMRSAFAHSDEAQADLTRFYNQILGRAPDLPGMASWTTALAHGTALREVRAGLAHSAEATTDLASLFQSVMARAPDMAELAGLQNRLTPPGATLTGVRAEVAARGASGFTVVTPSSSNLTATSAPEAFDFSNVTFGAATIAGFDPSQDAIRFTAAPGSRSAGTLPPVSAVAGGTLIALDPAHSVTLAGIAPGSLSAANLRFA